MSDLATATATATNWITKSGTVKARATSTGALSAPKAVQVAAALASDLTRWINGQFATLVRDVRACLSDKQALQVANASTLNPSGKPDTLAFIVASLAVLSVNAKGEKARIAALVLAVQGYEVERETLRLETDTQTDTQDDTLPA